MCPSAGWRSICRSPTDSAAIACSPPGARWSFAAGRRTGARESGSAQALILDAGTALTVDALGMRGGEPAFLGGAIAPGPELLSRAMGRGAAQLFEVETRGLEPERVPALGRSTREALESGIVHGLRGAARELVERIAQSAGLEQAPVFLCGGAAPLLHDARLFPGHALHLEPLLVHRGLLAADRASS